MSNSLRPHESQNARPPCPSPTPGVYSNSCTSSQWWRSAISSSVILFSCPQPLSALAFFLMSQLFYEVATINIFLCNDDITLFLLICYFSLWQKEAHFISITFTKICKYEPMQTEFVKKRWGTKEKMITHIFKTLSIAMTTGTLLNASKRSISSENKSVLKNVIWKNRILNFNE